MIDPASVPAIPVTVIEMTDRGETAVDGVLVPAPPEFARAEAIRWVSVKALSLGRPVRAVAVEADGTRWPLIVDVDGEVTAVDAHPTPDARPGPPGAPVEEAPARPAGRQPAAAPVRFETVEVPRARGVEPVQAPVPAPPAVSAAAPPVAESAPEPAAAEHRHDLLVRIRAAVEAGDWTEARARAEQLIADDPHPPRGAREVRAYVAALSGEPELAARIYAELVLEPEADTESEAVLRRLAGNAYTSWRRVARLRAGLDVGPSVLRAQVRVHGADDPATEVARRWLEELRLLD
ncbi:tetratricopeptide repeat protein [Embleya sp. MST-111070]|uniref:tetratricopeptide repeat protein n=1 Tax=Embleya sp. MST-111070 TaxID=3398231 RepID=UPI003F735313